MMDKLQKLAEDILFETIPDAVDILMKARKDGIISRFRIDTRDHIEVLVWSNGDEYVLSSGFIKN